jgi:hypothetical protein
VGFASEKGVGIARPWACGLCSLFTSVQEELLSQWCVLPLDSLVHQLGLTGQNATFEPIIVPQRLPLRLERGKDCEELAEELRTIRHKRSRGGLTIEEIRTECSSFRIWKRVEVLTKDDTENFFASRYMGLGVREFASWKAIRNRSEGRRAGHDKYLAKGVPSRPAMAGAKSFENRRRLLHRDTSS